MQSYLLQDFTTIRGSTITPVIQSEASYLAFSGYQDMLFWIDLREISPPGAGNVTLAIETAPSKDEVFWTPMTTQVFAVGAAVGLVLGPSLPSVILARGPTQPLMTWVRWKLTASVAATWDITFRIILSANKVSKTDGPGSLSPESCGCHANNSDSSMGSAAPLRAQHASYSQVRQRSPTGG